MTKTEGIDTVCPPSLDEGFVLSTLKNYPILYYSVHALNTEAINFPFCGMFSMYLIFLEFADAIAKASFSCILSTDS